MLKIQTKTLSLRYHPREDRMKLIINKGEEDSLSFWITRRFYLSTLFHIDTYLESIDMEWKKSSNSKKEKKTKNEELLSKNTSQKIYLLDNLKLSTGEKRKRFFISFHSESFEWETLITTDTFLNFYAMMKNTFPKNEWGII